MWQFWRPADGSGRNARRIRGPHARSGDLRARLGRAARWRLAHHRRRTISAGSYGGAARGNREGPQAPVTAPEPLPALPHPASLSPLPDRAAPPRGAGTASPETERTSAGGKRLLGATGSSDPFRSAFRATVFRSPKFLCPLSAACRSAWATRLRVSWLPPFGSFWQTASSATSKFAAVLQ